MVRRSPPQFAAIVTQLVAQAPYLRATSPRARDA